MTHNLELQDVIREHKRTIQRQEWHEASLAGKPDVIRSFGGEELDLAFGRPNVIHAALLAGPASSNLLACIEAWRAFRCDEHDAARDEPAFAGVKANRDSVSPGQRNA
jgi:hypothetical protein